MKIKNILIAAVALFTLTAISNKAQAQVTLSNSLPCYYVGVFISDPCPLMGYPCPGSASGYYYDIPDNYTWTEMGPGLIDQNGIYQAPSDINGMCLLDINSGQTYLISFCRFGPTGTVTIPAPNGCNGGPLNVHWDLTVSPAVIKIF